MGKTPESVRTQGRGHDVVLVHPGLDDGRSWKRVARRLSQSFRVTTYTRLRYTTEGRGSSMADEAAELSSIAVSLSSPVAVLGHSSGGIVALEALSRTPGLFSSALIYEAPIEADEQKVDPLVIDKAAHALDEHRPAAAVRIFAEEIVGLSPIQARIAQLFTTVSPKLRRLAPCQLDDVLAIRALGNRLGSYASIASPTLLLDGANSPLPLRRRTRELHQRMLQSRIETLPRQGHAAQQQDPRTVSRIVSSFLVNTASEGLDS